MLIMSLLRKLQINGILTHYLQVFVCQGATNVWKACYSFEFLSYNILITETIHVLCCICLFCNSEHFQLSCISIVEVK